jgi:hypothetical protein
MKQFKARVEYDGGAVSGERLHAMEFWFQSADIISAAQFVHDLITPQGFENGDVKKLIDITPEDQQ